MLALGQLENLMRLLALTNLYPNPYQPHRATFNRQQIRALAAQHEVRVIAPILWTDELRERRRQGAAPGRQSPREHATAWRSNILAMSIRRNCCEVGTDAVSCAACRRRLTASCASSVPIWSSPPGPIPTVGPPSNSAAARACPSSSRFMVPISSHCRAIQAECGGRWKLCRGPIASSPSASTWPIG